MMLALEPAGPAVDLSPLAANRIAARFGARFAGVVENQQEIPVAIGATFFSSAAELIGRVLKVVNKA